MQSNYKLFNWILAGVVILMFCYSGFYGKQSSAPIVCQYEQRTGQVCPTCGFTRSFGFLLSGDWESARVMNPLGVAVFSFFCIELLLRLGINAGLSSIKSQRSLYWLLAFDIIQALGLFLWAFIPVIRQVQSFA
ncbi:MAG: DUF2752 domain-containing protein [Bacteroidota bacterium]